jgi:hypothetical protein
VGEVGLGLGVHNQRPAPEEKKHVTKDGTLTPNSLHFYFKNSYKISSTTAIT